MEHDEEGQLSTSLVINYMVEATKTLLKLLHDPLFHAFHGIKKGPTLFAVHMPQTWAVTRGGVGERRIGSDS